MLIADGGGGGGVSAGEGLADLGKQISAMKDSAASGQFSVNDEGGKALLGAIDQMSDWLEKAMLDSVQLEREGQYGTSHGARVVEPYMNKVATDQDGFVPMLKKFNAVLRDAREAIDKAMGNYKETEQSNAGGVSSVQI